MKPASSCLKHGNSHSGALIWKSINSTLTYIVIFGGGTSACFGCEDFIWLGTLSNAGARGKEGEGS